VNTFAPSTIARTRSIGLRIAFGSAIAASILTLAAGPVAAATPPAFNSIPSPLPGNVSSVGFEATGTSEFGDYIVLGGTQRSRAALPVTVVMSIWACQSDATVGGACTTTPGATFAQPLTLKIYGVDHSGTVPAASAQPLLEVIHTFNLPYRPSYDPNDTCPPQAWRNATDGKCYNGMAYAVRFTLPSGADLPDELIWSISFDTCSSGYHPTGGENCKKPYNSLNVSAATKGKPSSGSEGEDDGVFINTRNGGDYGDNAAAKGTFADATGWKALKPEACLGVTCPVSGPVATPTPIQSVEGATGRPTPARTSTSDTYGGNSDPTALLLICNALGLVAIAAIATRRRTLRRKLSRG
jgi:hypothetical protein